jgi:hypothetical protein
VRGGLREGGQRAGRLQRSGAGSGGDGAARALRCSGGRGTTGAQAVQRRSLHRGGVGRLRRGGQRCDLGHGSGRRLAGVVAAVVGGRFHLMARTGSHCSGTISSMSFVR